MSGTPSSYSVTGSAPRNMRKRGASSLRSSTTKRRRLTYGRKRRATVRPARKHRGKGRRPVLRKTTRRTTRVRRHVKPNAATVFKTVQPVVVYRQDTGSWICNAGIQQVNQQFSTPSQFAIATYFRAGGNNPGPDDLLGVECICKRQYVNQGDATIYAKIYTLVARNDVTAQGQVDGSGNNTNEPRALWDATSVLNVGAAAQQYIPNHSVVDATPYQSPELCRTWKIKSTRTKVIKPGKSWTFVDKSAPRIAKYRDTGLLYKRGDQIDLVVWYGQLGVVTSASAGNDSYAVPAEQGDNGDQGIWTTTVTANTNGLGSAFQQDQLNGTTDVYYSGGGQPATNINALNYYQASNAMLVTTASASLIWKVDWTYRIAMLPKQPVVQRLYIEKKIPNAFDNGQAASAWDGTVKITHEANSDGVDGHNFAA